MQQRKTEKGNGPQNAELIWTWRRIQHPDCHGAASRGQTFCRPIHEQEDEKSQTQNSRVSLALRDYLVWPRLAVSPSARRREPGAPCDLTAHFKVESLDDLSPACKVESPPRPKWGRWERADFPTRARRQQSKELSTNANLMLCLFPAASEQPS